MSMELDTECGRLGVSLAEIARYLRIGRRIPDGELAERTLRLRDKAMAAIRPASVWSRFSISSGAIVSGAVRIDICGTLARHLDGCRCAYLACGTLGTGFDTFHRRVSVSSGADAFIVQAIGAALIERLMDSVEEDICSELSDGERLIARYSPGYGTFPLSAQRELLALLDAPRTVGVSLTDTMLMAPSKSVSAIIGVKNEEIITA